MNDPASAYQKGLVGEDLASEYLQKKGMVLLAKRYRSLYGEIDIIARDGSTLVFVEVKMRSRGKQGTGLIAIAPWKQKRLMQTASIYLAEHPPQGAVRFDAIEITSDGVIHISNAFDTSTVSP